VNRAIVDTGPIVALLSAADRWHAWSKAQFARVNAPLLTCEAVISEAGFILRGDRQATDALFGLLDRGVLELRFELAAEHAGVRALVKRYANVPMSVADACLVRMSELVNAPVLTLDGDFRIYRRLGRQVIPLLAPGPG
jgi:predicted nucleic acid-binding protein